MNTKEAPNHLESMETGSGSGHSDARSHRISSAF